MAEPSTPTEGSPEEIPEEIPREPGGKKGAWWKIVAVIIVIVVIISVIAVVYLLPQQGPAANQAPSITQTTESASLTDVNSPVTFTAQATDPDNDALTYSWNFGDGSASVTGSFANGTASVSHSFSLSGQFIGLLTVNDGHDHNVTNDGSLLYVTSKLSSSSVKQPDDCTSASCAVGPVVPVLSASASTTQVGTQITFNGNGSWAYDFVWANASDHSLGGSYNPGGTPPTAADEPSLFSSFVYNWGDGTPSASGNSTTVGQVNHTFNAVGLYFVKLTVTYTRSDLTGSPVVASAGYSVRVLSVAPSAQVKYPDVFTYATFGEPQYLDPALDYETSGGEILQVAYEPLLTYPNNDTLTYEIPDLATTIPTVANGGISADGLNYTFNLRNNVTFHNGYGNMKASDVAFTFQRALAMHDPSGPTWMIEQVLNDYVEYYVGGTVGDWINDTYANGRGTVPQSIVNIIGAEPTWDTEALTTSMAWAISNTTVQATGAYTVVFHLTRPYPAFLAVMAFTVGDVVSQTCVMANGGVQWGQQNQALNDGTDCGTGPYQITSWVHNQIIILTRFDSYWGPKAAIKEVHIVKANDIATRELMMFSGDADTADIGWQYGADMVQADGTTPKAGLRIIKGLPTLNVDFIGFDQLVNATNSPDPWTLPANFFADVHMRKAFSYAFDYQTNINKVLHGGGIPLNGAIPKGMLGYNPSIPYFTFDLSKAAAEMQQTAYWTSGFSMTLYYNTGNNVRLTEMLLLKSGLEALHTQAGMPGTISITVRGLDWPVYLTMLRHHGAGAFALGWLPDYADPDDYVLPFLHTGQTYPLWMAYSNTTLDTMIDAASAELNPTVRSQMYQTISYDASVYDVPYIWTFQAVNYHVERSWVQGWYFNAMNSGVPFYALSK